MFETIKEFEDYIFSIETEEQLQKAKYGELDCLSFYLNLNEEIKPLLLSEIRIRSYSLPDQQWASINNKFYPLIAVLLDFEKRKSKEEELIDEEVVAFLNQIRNSSKDVREEIKRRFVQRVNFDIKKIERILLKFDNGYYDRIYEEENFTLTPEEEKVVEIIQDATFDKAMQMGLIEYNKGYKWKGTNGELALFAELLSEKLSIKKKWKVFEEFFKVQNLDVAKQRVVGSNGTGCFGPHEKVIKILFGAK